MRRLLRAFRYVLAYVFAMLVGLTAVNLVKRLVELAFGTVTGPASLGVAAADLAVAVVVTAWAFSIFAVPAPRRRPHRHT